MAGKLALVYNSAVFLLLNAIKSGMFPQTHPVDPAGRVA
jgi:hypothetical protein